MNRLVNMCAAGAAAAIVAAACVETRGTLYVQGVMLPPQAQAGQACLYEPQSSAPLQLHEGKFDVAFANSYVPVLLLANNMVQRGSAVQLRVETSRIQLQGATVRLTDAQGAQMASFTALSGGYVEASNGTTPGYAAFSITVVDPDTAGKLRAELVGKGLYSSKRVVAYVKPYGQTLGGLRVEAGEFQWPIQVCYGCLVSFPVEAQDTTIGVPNCLNSGTGSSQIAQPCAIGQDQMVDCRLLCPLVPKNVWPCVF